MKTASVFTIGLLTALLAGCTTTQSTRPVPFEQRVTFTGDYINLTEVDQKPVSKSLRPPRYPFTWSRQAVNGSAVVSFIIDKSGTTTQVQCSQATDKEFGAAAVAAVKQWRYTPARQNGQIVACAAEQRINFNLRDTQ